MPRYGGQRISDMMQGRPPFPTQQPIAGQPVALPMPGGITADPTGAGLPGGVLPAPGQTAGVPGQPGAVPGAPGGAPPIDPRINPELGGYGSLMQSWEREFTSPTMDELQQDPGYQFRLQEGMDAIQHSAAARGGITTGATLEDLTRYSQGLASTEYGSAYGRARDEYESAYRTFQQNQANQYSRLMGISGMGQQAVGQYGQAGQYAAGTAAGIYGQSAGQIGQSYQNQAGAQASGIAGQANAWMGGLQGVGGSIQDMMMMQYLNPGQQQESSWRRPPTLYG